MRAKALKSDNLDIEQISVSLPQLATFLKTNERRTRKLVEAGVLPNGRGRRYPLLRSVQAYVEHLRGIPKPAGGKSLTDARALLAAEKAIIATLQRKRLEGGLVSIDGVERGVQAAFLAFRSRLLAIPTRTAPRLAVLGETKQIFSMLTDEIHAALLEISGYRYAAEDAEAEAPREAAE